MMADNKRAGVFTLIEMVVILVIMAIIAAIAAPRLGRFLQQEKLNSTVYQFKTFLNAGRTTAMTNRGECRVVILPGWQKIIMEERRPPVINSPQELAQYIKTTEGIGSDGFKRRIPSEFVPVNGTFSAMKLPAGVRFMYISVSGRRMSPAQTVTINFVEQHQNDEVDFVLENQSRNYIGLRLPAGSGIPEKLNVIKE